MTARYRQWWRAGCSRAFLEVSPYSLILGNRDLNNIGVATGGDDEGVVMHWHSPLAGQPEIPGGGCGQAESEPAVRGMSGDLIG